MPGRELPGCFVYRTLDDLDSIRAAHVVELAPRLMPQQADEGGRALLRQLVEELGVSVRLSPWLAPITQGISPNESSLTAAPSDGTELGVDLVVFAAGVRPRDQLAREAGLATGPRGGIFVDEGCGSCLPTLKKLLADSGAPVSRALCEHFPLTRAELFEVVRAEGITTFTELVGRHGPALQDTNDHFLANIQRNGTYSVVPRIAGGEVTPGGAHRAG